MFLGLCDRYSRLQPFLDQAEYPAIGHPVPTECLPDTAAQSGSRWIDLSVFHDPPNDARLAELGKEVQGPYCGGARLRPILPSGSHLQAPARPDQIPI
jgi:hypothetical protein